MLFNFLSSSRFSVLTVASASGFVPEAAPVVTPGAVFAPDDCAVPALLVPGDGAGELATPPVGPVELPVVCANEMAGVAARAKITIKVLIEAGADDFVIGLSPCPINGCSKGRFRNKSRHISLKQGGSHDHA
jgi:hypothetical protein